MGFLFSCVNIYAWGAFSGGGEQKHRLFYSTSCRSFFVFFSWNIVLRKQKHRLFYSTSCSSFFVFFSWNIVVNKENACLSFIMYGDQSFYLLGDAFSSNCGDYGTKSNYLLIEKAGSLTLSYWWI
jgi:hypothetical protein